MFKPKLETCKFVRASVVFEGLAEAWAALSQKDNLPFSWGDNNRSLVDADTIVTELEQVDNPGVQVKKALARLRKLGQTYVDLEN